jgi:phosphate uptake regulator
MQVRKLVKSGNSSLVVAVPSDWIKRNKLKQGNLVYIDEHNNILSVKTEFKEEPTEKKEIIINIDNKKDRVISRDINSAYLDNYEYLIIKGNDLKEKYSTVKIMIGDLIAMEIIDESSNKIVAKNFLKIRDSEPKVLLRRMDNILRSMITDAKEALKSPEIVPNIFERDKQVNRLNYLLSKIVKVAYKDKSVLSALDFSEMDVLRYWEISGQLEKIGDRVKDIAKLMTRIRPNHRKDCLDLFSQIEKLYRNVMKAFHESSIKLSDEVACERLELNNDIEKFISKSSCAICSQIAASAFDMLGHINDVSRITRFLN